MRPVPWRAALRTARDRALASDRIVVLAGRGTADRRRRTPLARLLPPVRHGLPPGLEPTVVEAAVTSLGANGIDRCAHVALSGWKHDTWTSRVFVVDGSGDRFAVVAKVTDYDDHVPAFDGLPYQPGRPELAVLRAVIDEPDGPLAAWMPRPLLAEPLDDHRFVFVFADVGRTHGARTGATDMLRAIDALTPMQAALRATAVPPGSLLDLRPDHHADELAAYVRRHLAGAPEPGASDLARQADALLGACAVPAWAEAAVGPVHGDPNRSNVLFSRVDDDLAFIDWEWAGLGLPHADLACLTKVVPPELEDVAVMRFADADPSFTHDQHRQLHTIAKLHRSLLDASFLAAQRAAKPGGVRFDLESPIRRAGDAAAQLLGGRLRR